MISEFSTRVKSQNNKAKFAFFGCLSLAAVATVVYLTADRFRGIIGLFAVGFVVAAVFFYTKYIAAEYFYDITFDAASAPVFVVRQRVGRKNTTLCRMDLYAVIKVERQTREDRSKHKTEAGYVKYVYTPTLSPEFTYLVTVRSRYEKAEIRIECSDEFAALLLEYAAQARELRTIAEAEEEY